MKTTEDYLEGQIASHPSNGLPPLVGHHELTDPSRKRKSFSKRPDSLDMLKLATHNALSHSNSFENLSTLSKSPGKQSPRIPRAFEILLKHPSESDLLIIDDSKSDENKPSVFQNAREDSVHSRDGSVEYQSSRGSSFDFDSGVSSLTSVSMNSARSLIQLKHSTTIAGWTASQLAEVHQRLEISQTDINEADPDEEDIGRWNLTSFPSFIFRSVRSQRPRSKSEDEPALSRSFSSILFRKKTSRVFPDPETDLPTTRNQEEDDDVLSEKEDAAKRNGAKLLPRHSV